MRLINEITKMAAEVVKFLSHDVSPYSEGAKVDTYNDVVELHRQLHLSDATLPSPAKTLLPRDALDALNTPINDEVDDLKARLKRIKKRVNWMLGKNLGVVTEVDAEEFENSLKWIKQAVDLGKPDKDEACCIDENDITFRDRVIELQNKLVKIRKKTMRILKASDSGILRGKDCTKGLIDIEELTAL